MGASVGAGIYLLLRFFDRLQASGGPIPADMRRWRDELEMRAMRAVQADMQAAEARVALVRLIEELPADYDPTALLAVQIAAGVHRAMVAQAEKDGIIQRGTFERVYGVPAAHELEAEAVIAETKTGTSLEARPRWVNGKLVVR